MSKLKTLDQENQENLKNYFSSEVFFYLLALYAVFVFVDLFFYREFFFEFFQLRSLFIVSLLAVAIAFKRLDVTNHKFAQLLCLIPVLVNNLTINYMIFKIGDPRSFYWGGLALSSAGLSIGFVLDWTFYFLIQASILVPFFIISFQFYTKNLDLSSFLPDIFLLSIFIICAVGRRFYVKLTESDYTARVLLANEIESRNKIIENKTAEGIRLNQLTKQFSPQIVESIKNGGLNLNANLVYTDICVIFVDIKDSTPKYNSLPLQDIQKIINLFMDEVMAILLKHDITIDKFLGDGIMGFSNSPKKHEDYVLKVVSSAIEILKNLNDKRSLFEGVWKSEFKVRIGIACGPAAVGFYGNETYFKSFTALGRVVNLSSRLNGASGENQIAISADAFEQIKNSSILNGKVKVSQIENQRLKGFDPNQSGFYMLEPNFE